MRLLASLLGLLLSGMILGTSARADDILDTEVADCKYRFPSLFSDYFARDACVSDAKKGQRRRAEDEKKSRAEDEARARDRALEEAARPCIAQDLPRVEKALTDLKLVLSENATIEEAKVKVTEQIDANTSIVIARDDILQKVVVGNISPKCSTKFNFLINIRFNQQDQIRWLRTYAQNTPMGYEPPTKYGYVEKFSFDYEEMRRQKAAAASKAIADAVESKRRQEAAIAEEKRRQENAATEEVRRQQSIIAQNHFIREKNEVLRSLQYVNFSAKQVNYVWNDVNFNFSIRNQSKKVIKKIFFGWDLYQSSCPAALSTKKTFPEYTYQDPIRIAPGETMGFSFVSERMPANFILNGTPCFRVTDVEFD